MLHAVVLRMTMIRRMLLLMLTKKLNAMIKSSQIKSVRLCWQMRGGDVWRMLWRGDNSHRSVADTFSQIFTILSHVFSRVNSLAHTYIRHRHTHTRHRHKQDTDTKKRHRHKLSQSQKMKHTIKYCVCAFYFQWDWVWLCLNFRL